MEDWDYTPDGRLNVDALVGWMSHVLPSGRGCLLRLQAAHSATDLSRGRRRAMQLSITANQARVLGSYLVKLADEIEGHPPAMREPSRWLR